MLEWKDPRSKDSAKNQSITLTVGSRVGPVEIKGKVGFQIHMNSGKYNKKDLIFATDDVKERARWVDAVADVIKNLNSARLRQNSTMSININRSPSSGSFKPSKATDRNRFFDIRDMVQRPEVVLRQVVAGGELIKSTLNVSKAVQGAHRDSCEKVLEAIDAERLKVGELNQDGIKKASEAIWSLYDFEETWARTHDLAAQSLQSSVIGPYSDHYNSVRRMPSILNREKKKQEDSMKKLRAKMDAQKLKCLSLHRELTVTINKKRNSVQAKVEKYSRRLRELQIKAEKEFGLYERMCQEYRDVDQEFTQGRRRHLYTLGQLDFKRLVMLKRGLEMHIDTICDELEGLRKAAMAYREMLGTFSPKDEMRKLLRNWYRRYGLSSAREEGEAARNLPISSEDIALGDWAKVEAARNLAAAESKTKIAEAVEEDSDVESEDEGGNEAVEKGLSGGAGGVLWVRALETYNPDSRKHLQFVEGEIMEIRVLEALEKNYSSLVALHSSTGAKKGDKGDKLKSHRRISTTVRTVKDIARARDSSESKSAPTLPRGDSQMSAVSETDEPYTPGSRGFKSGGPFSPAIEGSGLGQDLLTRRVLTGAEAWDIVSSNKEGMAVLNKFMQREMSIEHLDFLLEVERFEDEYEKAVAHGKISAETRDSQTIDPGDIKAAMEMEKREQGSLEDGSSSAGAATVTGDAQSHSDAEVGIQRRPSLSAKHVIQLTYHAKMIYERFIAQLSQNQVNISDRLRKSFDSLFKGGSELKIRKDLFITAKREVRRLIERDTLMRFVTTPEFKEFLESGKAAVEVYYFGYIVGDPTRHGLIPKDKVQDVRLRTKNVKRLARTSVSSSVDSVDAKAGTPAPKKVSRLRRLKKDSSWNLYNLVRGQMSKEKRRFKTDQFDLDLSFITPSIIAMGLPAEGREAAFLNKIDDVERFLDAKYGQRYVVYNLCAEKTYNTHERFGGRVIRRLISDRNPCPFNMIPELCESVKSWVLKSPAHTVALHCRNGRGRTGMVVSCVLQHTNRWYTAKRSLRLFAVTRSKIGVGVTIPSQKLYVQYYQRYLADRKSIPDSRRMVIKEIKLSPIPPCTTDREVFFRVHLFDPKFTNEKRFCSREKRIACEKLKAENCIRFSVPSAPIDHDVRIAFKTAGIIKSKLFSLCFNTRFIARSASASERGARIKVQFKKKRLDRACKDTHHRLFQENFVVTLTLMDS